MRVAAGTDYPIAVHGGTAPAAWARSRWLELTPGPGERRLRAATALSGPPPARSTTRRHGRPASPRTAACTSQRRRSGVVQLDGGRVRACGLDYSRELLRGRRRRLHRRGVDALTTVVRSDSSYSSAGQRLRFDAVAGTTYRIALAGVYGDTGSYQVAVNPVAAPANDHFANATELTGTSAEVTGSTTDASRESGEPVHCTSTSSSPGSIWYRWTAPASGKVTLDYGTSFGGASGAVYTGTAVGQLTTVVKSSDYVAWQKSLTFNATAGTTYRIAMRRYVHQRGRCEAQRSSSGRPAAERRRSRTRSDLTGATTSTPAAPSTARPGPAEPYARRLHREPVGVAPVGRRRDGPGRPSTRRAARSTPCWASTPARASGRCSSVASERRRRGGHASAVTFVATAGTVYGIAVDGRSRGVGRRVLGST